MGVLVGPQVLLFALTAAVAGRMEKFSTALVAAIALGVLDQTLYFFSGNPSLASAVIAYSATAADRAHRVDQRIPKALCLEACEAVRRMRALVRGPIYIDLRTTDQKVRGSSPFGLYPPGRCESRS